MAGREAAELAGLGAAAVPELQVRTAQYAEGWYDRRMILNLETFLLPVPHIFGISKIPT